LGKKCRFPEVLGLLGSKTSKIEDKSAVLSPKNDKKGQKVGISMLKRGKKGIKVTFTS
jgi:hypothetical protein